MKRKDTSIQVSMYTEAPVALMQRKRHLAPTSRFPFLCLFLCVLPPSSPPESSLLTWLLAGPCLPFGSSVGFIKTNLADLLEPRRGMNGRSLEDITVPPLSLKQLLLKAVNLLSYIILCFKAQNPAVWITNVYNIQGICWFFCYPSVLHFECLSALHTFSRTIPRESPKWNWGKKMKIDLVC